MVLHRFLLILGVSIFAGCVSMAGHGDGRSVAGSDDGAAAAAILDLLRTSGIPAEPASDTKSVFVYRGGMSTLLSPIVQSDGLDRIVATRSYAPAPGHSDEDLRVLAGRLNESLNVGVFSVDGGALVFQSQMTFFDRLQSDELIAFLGWLDAAELAITRVDGSAGVLLISR
jgi:hypothetical protein